MSDPYKLIPPAPATPYGFDISSALYNPVDRRQSAGAKPGEDWVTPAGGGDWITDGLIARGMPPHLALAFGWNGMDESGLDAGINEANPTVPGSRGGFGGMQWTGPRRRALEAFAAERGVSPADKDLQLDFLMSELQGPEASAWAKISSAKDTPTAAAAIVNDFLRPAEEHRASREAKYMGGNAAYKPPAGGDNALAATGLSGPAGAPVNALAETPKGPQLTFTSQSPEAFMRGRNALALQPLEYQRRGSLG